MNPFGTKLLFVDFQLPVPLPLKAIVSVHVGMPQAAAATGVGCARIVAPTGPNVSRTPRASRTATALFRDSHAVLPPRVLATIAVSRDACGIDGWRAWARARCHRGRFAGR
jgi:hypothetical protein